MLFIISGNKLLPLNLIREQWTFKINEIYNFEAMKKKKVKILGNKSK